MLAWSVPKARRTLALNCLYVIVIVIGVYFGVKALGVPHAAVVFASCFMAVTMFCALVIPALLSLGAARKHGVLVNVLVQADGQFLVQSDCGSLVLPTCVFGRYRTINSSSEYSWVLQHDGAECCFFVTAVTFDPIDRRLLKECNRIGITVIQGEVKHGILATRLS